MLRYLHVYFIFRQNQILFPTEKCKLMNFSFFFQFCLPVFLFLFWHLFASNMSIILCIHNLHHYSFNDASAFISVHKPRERFLHTKHEANKKMITTAYDLHLIFMPFGFIRMHAKDVAWVMPNWVSLGINIIQIIKCYIFIHNHPY